MTIQVEPIRGKVAGILNSREVALNIGKRQGVTLGMEFDILSPKGSNVRDPDTGDVLGSIAIPKATVRVTKVEERISVASTFRKHRVNVGGVGLVGLGVTDIFQPPKWETRYETLKTNEKPWEDLDEEDSYVSTGDPVVQVFDLEDIEERIRTAQGRVAAA